MKKVAVLAAMLALLLTTLAPPALAQDTRYDPREPARVCFLEVERCEAPAEEPLYAEVPAEEPEATPQAETPKARQPKEVPVIGSVSGGQSTLLLALGSGGLLVGGGLLARRAFG